MVSTLMTEKKQKNYNLVQSVSEQAYALLRKKIETMSRQGIKRLPPEPDLAQQIGVSRVTIRRVLTRMEKERLIDRQKGRGTFIRPIKQPGKIVVLYDSHNDIFKPWTSSILRGVSLMIDTCGFQMDLRPLPTWGTKGLVSQLISDVRSHLVDGYLILLRLHLNDCLQLVKANIPAVWVEQNYGRKDIPVVLADHAEAVHIAMNNFAEHHRQRIAVISGPTGVETRCKADIIADTFASYPDAKVPVTAQTHIVTDRSLDEGRNAMRKLMRRKVPPDAVFTTDDDLAIGALLALRELFHNTEEYPDMISYVSPIANLCELLPWKVIETPSPELLGRESVSMLQSLMKGKSVQTTVKRLPPVDLVLCHTKNDGW